MNKTEGDSDGTYFEIASWKAYGRTGENYENQNH
jgi:hypothetical protein